MSQEDYDFYMRGLEANVATFFLSVLVAVVIALCIWFSIGFYRFLKMR